MMSRPGRVATAYFLEKAPSASRNTVAPMPLPARKPSTVPRSSWKFTVTTRALPPQRCATWLIRGTTSREWGDQEAQTMKMVAPWARSASLSRSPPRPWRTGPWADAGANGPAKPASRAKASAKAVTGRRRRLMACLSVGFEGRSMREVGQDSVSEAIGAGTADAPLPYHQEKLPRVVHLTGAFAAAGYVVSERGQQLILRLVVEEQEQHRSDLF